MLHIKLLFPLWDSNTLWGFKVSSTTWSQEGHSQQPLFSKRPSVFPKPLLAETARRFGRSSQASVAEATTMFKKSSRQAEAAWRRAGRSSLATSRPKQPEDALNLSRCSSEIQSSQSLAFLAETSVRALVK